jgi:CheY-like chemotaxis protein
MCTPIAVETLRPYRALIVGGGPEVLVRVEPLLGPGLYAVDFVELYESPHTVIRTRRPDVIVLCLRIEDHEGFHLLSLLRLDPATRAIPLLTYTTVIEGQIFEGVDEGDPAGMMLPGHDNTRLARH